jgi:hypothetical protein
MRSVVKVCLCLTALVVTASPAAANWQYTTWGMTPDQVSSAAHGNVLHVDPSARNSTDGDQILLETPYAAGTFNFKAGFAFDSRTHLDRVHLVLLSGDAVELHAALLKKYGDPQNKDSDFESFGGRITWITTDETIVLSQSGSNSPGVTPSVTLDYTRLSTASSDGL